MSMPHWKYRPYATVDLPDRTWPDRVLDRAPIWCSTDLRDGNQALVNPMDSARKRRFFDLLLALRIREIEVGFPSASKTDFDFARLLIEDELIPDDTTIAVLTQARPELIERTFEAIAGAKRAIVHLYNSTSVTQRRVVFRLDRDGITDLAVRRDAAVPRARRRCVRRDRLPVLARELPPHGARLRARDLRGRRRGVGADADEKMIVNLPTTVEQFPPNVYADRIEWFGRHFSKRDAAILSVHPHNDRGTAVATAELGLMAGAERVEGTLFGNGERTGNVDLITIALNLLTQGVDPGLDLSGIDEARAIVEECNELPVHPRHPYVGELVYTAFSGSHQDAIKKGMHAQERSGSDVWDVPYLPIDPNDSGGATRRSSASTRSRGRAASRTSCRSEHHLDLPRGLQVDFAQKVQAITDARGGELTSAELMESFREQYLDHVTPLELVGHSHSSEGGADRIAANLLVDGEERIVEGEGNGPIDALVNALGRGLGIELHVLDYHEHAMSRGEDANGRRLRRGGRRRRGRLGRRHPPVDRHRVAPGRAQRREPRARTCGPRRRPSRRRSTPRAAQAESSAKAMRSAATARCRSSRGMRQEIVIGEVEIIRRLIRSSASVRNIRAVTPGCERMPAPTSATLPRSAISTTSNGPIASCTRSSARRVASTSPAGTENETVAEPCTTSCRIVSTLTSSAAIASKIAAAIPGRSGSPLRSKTTSFSECVTAETMGCSSPSDAVDPGRAHVRSRARDDGVRELGRRRACRRDPASASWRERLSTACVERRCLVRPAEPVLEHERGRAEHSRRVRDPAPGDVGRRAVDRLEDPRPVVAEARRRRQPEPAGHRGGEVGEDVAEHVLGHDDVELLGRARELHGRVVDEHVLDLDVRILGGDLVDDAAPEPRRLEHVRLVDRRQLPAARAGELEAAPRDPLDLARVVLARVEDGAVVAHAARAEVEAADELAHDEEVDRARRARAAGSRRRRARRGAGACPARDGRPPRRTRDGRSAPSAPRPPSGRPRACPAAASRPSA